MVFNLTSGSQIHIILRANDSDDDPIKFSIDRLNASIPSNATSFGTLKDFDPNTGDVLMSQMVVTLVLKALPFTQQIATILQATLVIIW